MIGPEYSICTNMMTCLSKKPTPNVTVISMSIFNVHLSFYWSTIMSSSNSKITRYTKKQRGYDRKTKQSKDPDWEMTQMLKLSNKEFKITMLNMFRNSVDNMHEQIVNFNRKLQYARKSQTEMLSFFLKVTEMKSSFYRLTRTLNIIKEGIF